MVVLFVHVVGPVILVCGQISDSSQIGVEGGSSCSARLSAEERCKLSWDLHML